MIKIDYKKLVETAVVLSVVHDVPFWTYIGHLLYEIGVNPEDRDEHYDNVRKQVDEMKQNFINVPL